MKKKAPAKMKKKSAMTMKKKSAMTMKKKSSARMMKKKQGNTLYQVLTKNKTNDILILQNEYGNVQPKTK